ncbi:MAG: hypothetical protein HQL06_02465 [Nitrospirae bacterium]|nr:hypothetical protein [Nitrospirota bacterium]
MIEKTKLEQELENSELHHSSGKKGIFQFSLVLIVVASIGWLLYFTERNELKRVKEQLTLLTAQCEPLKKIVQVPHAKEEKKQYLSQKNK